MTTHSELTETVKQLQQQVTSLQHQIHYYQSTHYNKPIPSNPCTTIQSHNNHFNDYVHSDLISIPSCYRNSPIFQYQTQATHMQNYNYYSYYQTHTYPTRTSNYNYYYHQQEAPMQQTNVFKANKEEKKADITTKITQKN
eukprot:845765_1